MRRRAANPAEGAGLSVGDGAKQLRQAIRTMRREPNPFLFPGVEYDRAFLDLLLYLAKDDDLVRGGPARLVRACCLALDVVDGGPSPSRMKTALVLLGHLVMADLQAADRPGRSPAEADAAFRRAFEAQLAREGP